MKNLDYLIRELASSLVEQTTPPKKETNNAPSDEVDSPFTPAEEKFLGKFDAYGSTHLGIIYSISDIGIREFITRSGADLNLSPGILISLLRKNVIKIVPYTGYGMNTDYTLELQLSLDDVKGLGDEDKASAEGAPDASGAPADGADVTAGLPPLEPTIPIEPPLEVAWVIPYGNLLKESANTITMLLEKKDDKAKVHVGKSRVLKHLPKEYITYLERIIDMIGKKASTTFEKERMIADLLDNLAINLKLTDKEILKSYEFYKNQKRLQKELDLAKNK